MSKSLRIVEHVLKANDAIAAENRARLKQHGVVAVNMMSSPGSGKTLMLERTLEILGDRMQIGIIEGDIRTTRDADRLARFDVPIVQINTEPFGGDCHLGAHVISKALDEIELSALDMLLIENVGNLVCPAEFDIGENRKVVVLSTTEGEDKPLKYPLMFRVSHALLINKIDLLPYIDVDIEVLKEYVRKVNPHIEMFEVSAKCGEGIEAWTDWLVQLSEKTI